MLVGIRYCSDFMKLVSIAQNRERRDQTFNPGPIYAHSVTQAYTLMS